MEWFEGNWPVVLVVLAVALVFTGLLRRLLKLAFLGAAIGVVGLIIWPMVAS
ncbi:MAG: hypothetical protein GY724_02320 [Actinomycetia bacterium]|nr:hypothetical protein [Actinomycetes bacterium]